MKIIAFSGKKQSGKDTSTRFLIGKQELWSNSQQVAIISFAGCLKELVFTYFAAPTEEYKRTMHEPFTTNESKKKTHPCGKTYREILQLVGTDWFRSIWPDVWIENYKFRTGIDPDLSTILTPDVRFPNEVACVQQLGGHVIRLLRAPFPDDKHESETALDYTGTFGLSPSNEVVVYGKYFDAIIDNRNMDVPTQNEAVWKLVKEKKWI